MVSFTNFGVLALAASVLAVPTPTKEPNYSTYPAVPKTASINGFADPIYTQLPSCAQPCVKQDTKITPCPYWDTGCLCVMPQFAGKIADCVASSCTGSDVAHVTSLASSLCSKVGAPSPFWLIPDAAKNALATAAAK